MEKLEKLKLIEEALETTMSLIVNNHNEFDSMEKSILRNSWILLNDVKKELKPLIKMTENNVQNEVVNVDKKNE